MTLTKIAPGDIISYTELCGAENAQLQKGMNFRLRGGLTVVLMSTRPNAPYADEVLDDGRTLIYEGHNTFQSLSKNPDEVDQPAYLPSGRPTENGKFFESVERF